MKYSSASQDFLQQELIRQERVKVVDGTIHEQHQDIANQLSLLWDDYRRKWPKKRSYKQSGREV